MLDPGCSKPCDLEVSSGDSRGDATGASGLSRLPAPRLGNFLGDFKRVRGFRGLGLSGFGFWGFCAKLGTRKKAA